MGRPIVLSNNRIFIGLDEHGFVHDFYYPYVGQENLGDARISHHKIGIWCDGAFYWLDDAIWKKSLELESDALISTVRYTSGRLRLSIILKDTVLTDSDVFVRHITISNQAEATRDIRVFMHQVFQLSPSGRADTAVYVPEDEYILDYKGRFCLGIGGTWSDGSTFDQHAVGNYGVEGKLGTYKDAEDGELSNNDVEHGGVDSTIRFSGTVLGRGERSLAYWVVAGDDQATVRTLHKNMQHSQTAQLLESTRKYWQQWLEPARQKIGHLPTEHQAAIQKSLLIIKAHCDQRGSVLASGDSSIFNYGRDYYCYCWPRDAVYALWPLIRLGLYKEARQFFAFALDTMNPAGYMAHKYQPDRSIGSTWHPLSHNRRRELAIQEDETASVLRIMAEYYEASADADFLQEYYRRYIKPCANFLVGFIDEHTGLPHASYDLWEQKFMTSTYTVTTVISGLRAAAKLAGAYGDTGSQDTWSETAARIEDALPALFHPEGFYRKGYILQEDGNLAFDDTIDISNLYGMVMFTHISLEDEMIQKTLHAVTSSLVNTSPTGGVIRYVQDNYFLSRPEYSGNPWAVCTAWYAQCLIVTGKTEEALPHINWLLSHQLPSGVLSEQYDPQTGNAVGVAPLTWSHAELISTILDYHKI
jgi:GH15 family glucan-1,4-alpha-glucosidase